MTGPSADQASWAGWLGRIWRIPAFAAALQQASPHLAQRIGVMLEGRPLSDADARRVMLSTLRYLLRAQTRATPFGLFAGIAPARITPARGPCARIGAAHQVVPRVRTAWLSAVIDQLEGTPALLRRLPVVAADLLFERDGQIVLEHRSHSDPDGAPAHLSVRATDPVRAVLHLARRPVPAAHLLDRLAARFPTAAGSVIDTLLARLVGERILLTSLRPPSTATDPLGHVLAELDAVNAGTVREAAATINRLREVADRLCDPLPAAHPAGLQQAMTPAATPMRALYPGTPPLALDTRLDADVALPAAVAREAAAAAGVLVRLAGRSALSSGWIDWHERFLERYGPHALVGVHDAVDADVGLGYPAGYLGAPAPRRAAPTDRDIALLALAQRAVLDGRHEIALDDELIDRLSTTGPHAPYQPSTALTIRLDAPSAQVVAAGDYTLTVLAVSRHAATTIGRFLRLLEGEDLRQAARLCADAPTVTRDALTVQISASPLHTSSGDVACAPQACRHLLPIGEHHGGDQMLTVADLAITADKHRLYLLSRTLGRVVEPLVLNAVNPAGLHPLVRFLMEAPAALATPCTGFDWGPAAALPFLPALRHGRTIICPARWHLTAADLPGPHALWPDWDNALAAWRAKTGMPTRVYLGQGDRRIILDLGEPSHRALLRAHLRTCDPAALVPAPAPDAAGWIAGHAHELVLPLKSTAEPTSPPGRTRDIDGRSHGHLPGQGGHLYLKLYGHPDRQTAILLRHLPHLTQRLHPSTGPLAWWFLRYHDPDAHLRIRMTVPPHALAAASHAITTWSDQLRRRGLLGRLQWDTYYPETARFGGVAAMEAAEAYFAADSAAVLAQLAACTTAPKRPDARALTAAGLLDLAIALIGDTAEAMRWLIDHTRPDSHAPDRALYDQALALADPDHRHDLAADPGWHPVLTGWQQRRTAAAAYRRALRHAEVSAPDLLPDLLHLNHVRMAGTSPAGERACLHLARATAVRWIAARTPRRSP
ncbi:lantibiotic dehydratase [Spongiactinospora rosea]|uniref:lantibiotic dehydratase n=1 Tax=Spongiactinospora rosea TaxID=2248750 RepID=UPI0018F57CAA|nr:lantibiotic dehydratase [Spongiactinospora rosea]